jgi:cyclopropane fatty-acyl-phospholipid synthase-like methyltransferase
MKLYAPATERNREPILAVLDRVLPDNGTVLEIAAGSGEHAAFFARAFPRVRWLATDASRSSLASIHAWRAECGLENLLEPVHLDVTHFPWPVAVADAIVCINMIHISPWEATVALLRGAGTLLPSGGVLYTYGPYRVRDRETSASNERFEQWLKVQDSSYGLRWVHEVEAEAEANGLTLEETVDMPANNLSLIFRRG